MVSAQALHKFHPEIREFYVKFRASRSVNKTYKYLINKMSVKHNGYQLSWVSFHLRSEPTSGRE